MEIALAGKGAGFAYSALVFFSNRDGGISLFHPPPYFQGLSRDLMSFEQSSGQWDFPVPLEDSIELARIMQEI